MTDDDEADAIEAANARLTKALGQVNPMIEQARRDMENAKTLGQFNDARILAERAYDIMSAAMASAPPSSEQAQ